MKFLKQFGVLNSLRVTPGEIKKETQKKFKLAITGSADMVASFYEVISCGINLDSYTGESNLTADDFIQVVPFPIDQDARRILKYDTIIFLFNRQDADIDNLKNYRDVYKIKPPAHLFIEEPDTNEEKERLYYIMDDLALSGREWIGPPSVDTVKEKADVILNIKSKIDVAMAYRFPILRAAMARKLIHKTGMQNMIVALASSLPASIPIVGIIIGLLGAAGETTVLTINQLKLCIQLAGIYGLELNLIDRIKELWPLVGTAIGFRAMARSLVGFIPLAGPSIKGAIAYAGTHLVGETVRWYYEKGRKLTPDERKKIYEEALEKAKNTASKYLQGLKKAPKPDPEDGELEELVVIEEELKDLKEKMDLSLDDSPHKENNGIVGAATRIIQEPPESAKRKSNNPPIIPGN